jgi:hypothetical protein
VIAGGEESLNTFSGRTAVATAELLAPAAGWRQASPAAARALSQRTICESADRSRADACFALAEQA